MAYISELDGIYTFRKARAASDGKKMVTLVWIAVGLAGIVLVSLCFLMFKFEFGGQDLKVPLMVISGALLVVFYMAADVGIQFLGAVEVDPKRGVVNIRNKGIQRARGTSVPIDDIQGLVVSQQPRGRYGVLVHVVLFKTGNHGEEEIFSDRTGSAAWAVANEFSQLLSKPVADQSG